MHLTEVVLGAAGFWDNVHLVNIEKTSIAISIDNVYWEDDLQKKNKTKKQLKQIPPKK